jgi:hypothetical protein
MEITQPNKDRAHLNETVKITQDFVNSDLFVEQAKKKPNFFTRIRKLALVTLIFFMLNLVKKNIKVELDNFFEFIIGRDIKVSQQAFSKARQNIRWEVFRTLSGKIVEYNYEHGYNTWNGYRVSAIDGSKIQLPTDKKLREIFGTVGRNNTAPTAQASNLYDVLNGIIIDASIAPVSIDERTLAKQHLAFLINMPSHTKELVLFDRGYPSFELFKYCESIDITFLMRLKTKFNVQIDELPLGSHLFTLAQGEEKIKLRIVKLVLPSGEVETLVTNLFDHDLTEPDFKELYFKRWPIETHYGSLKQKLQLENFSSRTEEGIYQDFFISIYFYNIIAIASMEVQPVIDEARVHKTNKYKYKVNFNYTVGVFKNRFIRALLLEDRIKSNRIIAKILQRLLDLLTPDKLGRSFGRKIQSRKQRHPFNHKPNC